MTIKLLTRPTCCAACGGDLYVDLERQEPETVYYFLVYCPNPDCEQYDKVAKVTAGDYE